MTLRLWPNISNGIIEDNQRTWVLTQVFESHVSSDMISDAGIWAFGTIMPSYKNLGGSENSLHKPFAMPEKIDSDN